MSDLLDKSLKNRARALGMSKREALKAARAVLNAESDRGACPEYINVNSKSDGHEVGYGRLRWGSFNVTYNRPDGRTDHVYSRSIGDPLRGMFESEDERKKYTKKALLAVYLRHEELRRSRENYDER